MTFPNLPEDISPNIDLNPEDVALLILISIAFEELALAHVINSEAEKLQAALGTLVNPAGTTVFPGPLATDLQDLLDTNRSVEKMLRAVIKKEMLLQFKLEDIIDFLPTVTTTQRACDCALTPNVNVTRTGTAQIFPPAFPPQATPVLGTSTLHIVIALNCCTGANAFSWSYVRSTAGATAYTQEFTATTFNIECVFNDAGDVVGMTVTGEGTADGVGTGSFTGDATYVLLLDEVANTATLSLFNKATGALVFQTGPQALGVDIAIVPCT
jgi:hypothetical protein